MKSKVRRNLRKNNKFNWRKHIGKRALKEWLEKTKHVDIEIDPKDFDKKIELPIPLEFQTEEKSKIKVEYQPLNVQIKNGDNWEPLIPIRIWGVK